MLAGVTMLAASVSVRMGERMAPTYEALATHLLDVSRSLPPGKQHWVCVAGGPGAGKSTLAHEVASAVNRGAESEVCCVLPMDGWHYSRADLCRLDPPDAPAYLPRRGAPWTFDAEGCCASLAAARRDGEASLPTYSRELSDPVPDGVRLLTTHRIVLVEGNYLLMLGPEHDDGRWMPLGTLWDEKWFVKCPEAAEQRRRLIARHLETWNDEKTRRWGEGEAGAAARADANDVLNMELIRPCEAYADRVVESI